MAFQSDVTVSLYNQHLSVCGEREVQDDEQLGGCSCVGMSDRATRATDQSRMEVIIIALPLTCGLSVENLFPFLSLSLLEHSSVVGFYHFLPQGFVGSELLEANHTTGSSKVKAISVLNWEVVRCTRCSHVGLQLAPAHARPGLQALQAP